MRWLYIALHVFTIAACGAANNETQEPKSDPRLGELHDRQEGRKAEALTLRDPVNGWLVTGGDGMLWTGKYAAVTGVEGVNLAAAELEPGRFQRDPDGEGPSANPDWSDWSRDMGTGLVAYAWRKQDRALLERHIAYGEAHKAVHNDIPVWRMGEPVGDGRALYPPAFVGRLYQTQLALGGADNLNRLWPDFYHKGLTDFRAHLQVMNVWHRGEVAEALRKAGEADALPAGETTTDDAGDGLTHALILDVTDDQLAVLKEHAARDPRDPLFQAVLGTYTGDMTSALDACLAPDEYAGDYVRCDGNPRGCQLAALLFACDVVERRMAE